MAIQFPNNSLSKSGNSINVPNQIIQMVDNTSTVSTTATTASWVDVLSTNITITDSSNKVLVEYFMNDRSDQGNGNWCLAYHRILRGATQVMYSGYNGAQANYIGYYQRSFLDSPGAGTHTYTASVLSYSGTLWVGSYNSGSINHYLRLFEIGQ